MITISSSWDGTAADGGANSLQQCIRKISVEEAKNFKFDLDTMIEFESCAQLTKPRNCTEKKCNILLSSNKLVQFSRFLIISESKRAEIFNGSSGEYKFTKSGELIDDSDPDMNIYLIDIHLEKPCSSNVKVYLTGVDQNCWLLGVFVFLSDTSIESTLRNVDGTLGIENKSRFDLEEMNSLLKTTDLSDKAQSFKTLFETFQKSSSIQLPNIPLSIDPLSATIRKNELDTLSNKAANSAVLEKANVQNAQERQERKATSNASSGQKINLDLLNDLSLLSNLNVLPANISDGSGDCKCDHKCCKEQVKLVENSMKELEARVFKKLTEMETNQQHKMNQILEILNQNMPKE